MLVIEVAGCRLPVAKELLRRVAHVASWVRLRVASCEFLGTRRVTTAMQVSAGTIRMRLVRVDSLAPTALALFQV